MTKCPKLITLLPLLQFLLYFHSCQGTAQDSLWEARRVQIESNTDEIENLQRKQEKIIIQLEELRDAVREVATSITSMSAINVLRPKVLAQRKEVQTKMKGFFIVGMPTDFYGAVNACRARGGRLALPSSLEELQRSGAASSETPVWIAAHDPTRLGRFVSLHDGRPLVYTNWRQGEPNNVGGNEHYIAIFHGGVMNDVPSHAEFRPLCETGTMDTHQRY